MTASNGPGLPVSELSWMRTMRSGRTGGSDSSNSPPTSTRSSVQVWFAGTTKSSATEYSRQFDPLHHLVEYHDAAVPRSYWSHRTGDCAEALPAGSRVAAR